MAFWLGLALAAATFLLYLPSAQYPFIDYDDGDYVFSNEHVSSGLKWENVRWAFTGSHCNWHPLTWISHMLDCQVFGVNAGPQHLVNALLHSANAFLLFVLLLRMTGFLWRSLVVAAFFSLHPLRVESVVWIAERKDVLSTLFWLLTLFAYHHYAKQTTFRRYSLVALCFVLGLMAKPMVVTLPCVLLLLDYWPLNRLNSLADLRRLFVEKLPLFALSAVSSFVTFKVQKAGGAVVPVDLLPLYARLENALLSYGHYLAKMFWPDRLAIPVPFVDVRTVKPAILMAGIVMVGVTISVIWLGKRHKYLPVGWFLYLGTLVPVIGIVQVGGQGAAYRYTYIPSIGIALVVVWGLAEVFRRGQIPRSAIATLALTTFSACAALSFNQIGFWRNTETLFKHSLSIYPNHLDTANALAWSYATNPDRHQRNGPEAVRLAQFCLERIPFPDGQYLDTLAAAFAECGEFERAVEIEEKVLTLPRLPADLISQVKDHLELFKSGKTVNGHQETSIAPEPP